MSTDFGFLYKKIARSRDTHGHTEMTRLLYFALPIIPDRWGRFDAAPEAVKAQVSTMWGMDLDAIAASIEYMASKGTILLYEEAGVAYAAVTKWRKYQPWATRYITTPSEFPAPPDAPEFSGCMRHPTDRGYVAGPASPAPAARKPKSEAPNVEVPKPDSPPAPEGLPMLSQDLILAFEQIWPMASPFSHEKLQQWRYAHGDEKVLDALQKCHQNIATVKAPIPWIDKVLKGGPKPGGNGKFSSTKTVDNHDYDIL